MQKHVHAERARAMATSIGGVNMDPPRYPRVHALPSSGSVSGSPSVVDSVIRSQDPYLQHKNLGNGDGNTGLDRFPQHNS